MKVLETLVSSWDIFKYLFYYRKRGQIIAGGISMIINAKWMAREWICMWYFCRENLENLFEKSLKNFKYHNLWKRDYLWATTCSTTYDLYICISLRQCRCVRLSIVIWSILNYFNIQTYLLHKFPPIQMHMDKSYFHNLKKNITIPTTNAIIVFKLN